MYFFFFTEYINSYASSLSHRAVPGLIVKGVSDETNYFMSLPIKRSKLVFIFFYHYFVGLFYIII